jgi:hypothetical protein
MAKRGRRPPLAAKEDRVQRRIARIGAEDYLDTCARALVRQEGRLRQTRVPPAFELESSREFGREIMPDIWLTLVALNGSQRALALAAEVSQTQSKVIGALTEELAHRSSIKDARDVHEHLDDYFRGTGRLQVKEGDRPDMHLPQVIVARDATTFQIGRIEVRIGGSPWVDVLAAIEKTRQAVSKALELLRSEDQ